jgi:hypothetical protein
VGQAQRREATDRHRSENVENCPAVARVRFFFTLILAVLAGACAPAAVPPSAPTMPPAPTANPAPRELSKRQKLVAALRALDSEGDVLTALGKDLRAELASFVDQLGAKDKSELAKEGGPYARERPLLHLAAGGRSADALYEVATSPRLAQDLVTVHQAAGKQTWDEILPALRAVAEAAARRWLRERAVEAASPTALTPEVADRIDNAAQTLGRWDIVRLVREIACEIAPNDAERWISLSRAASRELDVRTAQAALAQAQHYANGTRMQRGRLARAKQSLESAEKVQKRKPTDAAGRIEVARAALDLQRFADARKLLEPDRAAAENDLALAATIAEADLEGSLCPGLPPGMGNTMLCALSWNNDARTAKAIGLLEKAWKSGKGRDERSIESYLAIVQIVPWMYSTVASGASPSDLAARFVERLRALQAAAKEAAESSAHFAGLVLLADTLAAGYETAENPKAKITAAARKQLAQRATTLAKAAPGDLLTQAAVLGVAALAFRDDDIDPLLALLPADVSPTNYLAHQVLRLWTGTTKQNAELARSASNEIAMLLPEYGAETLDRARLVLLLAEADAALQGTPKAMTVLEQVAKPLMDVNVPLELRLRASIDYAGARARAGKAEEGAEALEKIIATSPITQPDVKNFGLLGSSYLFVLRARAAKGAERGEYRDKFDKLAAEPGFADPPAAIRLWRELWKRELDYLVAEDRCGALAPCLAKAKRLRAVPTQKLEDEAGPELAKLVRRGVLPVGTLSIGFSFGTFANGNGGLEGVVSVNPALLAVEAP